ncbi:MAG: hypothetical protein KAG43_03990 [Candidatus Marithrix sp.]|nr:hypothetical protein [Candidatus Marithrix sp.]
MSESVLQISGSLLTIIQQAAEKNHISVNQFLLTAAKNSLVTVCKAPTEDTNSSYEQAMTAAFAEMDEGLPLGGQPLNWGNCLQIARSLEVEGPPDWSENIDDYLYGEKSDK